MGRGTHLPRSRSNAAEEETTMIHPAHDFAEQAQPIRVSVAPDRLGAIVTDQVRTIAAEGYSDFDVRWNGIALSIEARKDETILRRDFSPLGFLAMERIVERGITVERFFDRDGIAPVRENIFADPDDR
jgi:hypothetical protein